MRDHQTTKERQRKWEPKFRSQSQCACICLWLWWWRWRIFNFRMKPKQCRTHTHTQDASQIIGETLNIEQLFAWLHHIKVGVDKISFDSSFCVGPRFSSIVCARCSLPSFVCALTFNVDNKMRIKCMNGSRLSQKPRVEIKFNLIPAALRFDNIKWLAKWIAINSGSINLRLKVSCFTFAIHYSFGHFASMQKFRNWTHSSHSSTPQTKHRIRSSICNYENIYLKKSPKLLANILYLIENIHLFSPLTNLHDGGWFAKKCSCPIAYPHIPQSRAKLARKWPPSNRSNNIDIDKFVKQNFILSVMNCLSFKIHKIQSMLRSIFIHDNNEPSKYWPNTHYSIL